MDFCASNNNEPHSEERRIFAARLEGWPHGATYPHSSRLASRAPSASASNFAHMMLG
jgi:hypothetical protein